MFTEHGIWHWQGKGCLPTGVHNNYPLSTKHKDLHVFVYLTCIKRKEQDCNDNKAMWRDREWMALGEAQKSIKITLTASGKLY